MNTIITILMNPLLWFALVIFCMACSSEVLPVIKAFRVEQAKYPRFADIEGHKTAKIILNITVPGMFLSFVIGLIISIIWAGNQ